jgi:hypothetical protein
MEKTRQSIFETNSSSVHTLVFPKPEKEMKIHPSLVDKNGVITVECDYFGDSGVVYGQYEKLKYLCTWIALATGHGPYGDSSEDFSADDCWELRRYLLEPIKETDPSVKNIIVTKVDRAGFDHQTHPHSCGCVVDFCNEDVLMNFIFNDDIKILMSRD